MTSTATVAALLAAAVAAALAAAPGQSGLRGVGTPTRGPVPADPSAVGAGTRAPTGAPAHVAVGARHRWVLTPAAGLGVALVVGGLVGVVAGVLAAVTAWHLMARVEPAAVRRRREQLAAMLPHVVDLLSAALSAGCSPAAAVAMVADVVDAPMREELGLVSGRLALGVDPVRVWSDVAGHPQLGVLGRALVRAIDSGAPVSAALQRLADDLRRANRAEVESQARAVGVKAAAPLGLLLLPAFILVGIVPLVASSLGTVLIR